MGRGVLSLSPTITFAELESAAFALVFLAWAEGTSSVLLRLRRWFLLIHGKTKLSTCN